jgi:hypothetical protein
VALKIGRNDPCACGSGKKFKKCCLSAYVDPGKAEFPNAWMESDGIHIIEEGLPPTPDSLSAATKIYQENIRNSPLWDEMVKKFGEDEAERLLTQFRVKMR